MSNCTDWYTAIIVVLIAVICALVVRLNKVVEADSKAEAYVLSDLRRTTEAAVTAGFLDQSSSESDSEPETEVITNNGPD